MIPRTSGSSIGASGWLAWIHSASARLRAATEIGSRLCSRRSTCSTRMTEKPARSAICGTVTSRR
jgi:hypothetical protein